METTESRAEMRAAFEADYFGDAPANILARQRCGDGYSCQRPQEAWALYERAWQAFRATLPQAGAGDLIAAYAKGFYAAAGWAKRPDLYADIGSPAYVKERADLLASLIAQAAPSPASSQGWQLVPVEPTDDMFIEGMTADCCGRPSIDDDRHVRSIWKAMLDAAPKAPPPASVDGG